MDGFLNEKYGFCSKASRAYYEGVPMYVPKDPRYKDQMTFTLPKIWDANSIIMHYRYDIYKIAVKQKCKKLKTIQIKYDIKFQIWENNI